MILLIIILIALYIAGVILNLWLADIDNPESYWYCDDDYDQFLVLLMCCLPICGVLAMLVTTERFQNQ